MRKCDEYLSVSCYRYAPERFKAYRVTGFSNGNRNIPEYEEIQLNSAEISTCGNALLCKGREAAIAEVKRILRKRDRATQYVTYGFRFAENPRQYIYIPGNLANVTDFPARVRAYKYMIEHAERKGWKHATMQRAELGAGGKVDSVSDIAETIDRNNPVIIKIA